MHTCLCVQIRVLACVVVKYVVCDDPVYNVICFCSSLPVQVHIICHCLHKVLLLSFAVFYYACCKSLLDVQAVAGVYPGSELNAVCSAFFLRFINPALGKDSVLNL